MCLGYKSGKVKEPLTKQFLEVPQRQHYMIHFIHCLDPLLPDMSDYSKKIIYPLQERVQMSICVCPLLRLLITIDMLLTPDWLNKFYSCYVYIAAVVGFISRHGLSIDACCENLTLYKPSVHFNSSLKRLYISIKMERFGYKGGCGVTRIKRRASFGYI